MIEIQNVTKRFPQGKMLFHNLGLRLGKGEFITVTGPSGAGKTSLLQLMYGFLRPSEGAVMVDQMNLYHLNEYDRALFRRKIGYVFQDFRLISHRTVAENIAMPLMIRGLTTKQIQFEVEKVMARMGILDFADEFPSTLSGGAQQKVSVARAIIHHPEWLFADEPTGNLDPGSTLEMMNLFQEIHRQGTSVILATHDEALVKSRPGVCIRLERGAIRGQYS